MTPSKIRPDRQFTREHDRLNSGMPGSPTEYLAGTDLVSAADDGIAGRALHPFIAVMPAAGAKAKYNGEWAGPWEQSIVADVVPWVDAHLATIDSASGRTLAGLSAGGFGAFDIGLRNSSLFGAIESWSGYFSPLHDGPFKHAPKSVLRANDPMLLAQTDRRTLTEEHTRFFLSTGPYHSHWFRPGETTTFAAELRGLGLPVTTFVYPQAKGQWVAQVDVGLTWAFGT